MKELEKILRDLESKGFEQVSIAQVLIWIAQIKRDNRLKKGGHQP